METELYFDYLPGELMMIIFEYLGPNSRVFNVNKYKDLYNKFVDKIKRGMVLPEYVFNNNTFIDIEDVKDDIEYIIYDCDHIKNVNINGDSIGIQFTTLHVASKELKDKFIQKISADIVYLQILDGSDYQVIYIYCTKDKFYYYFECIENYGDDTTASLDIIIKTSDNWYHFYNDILNEVTRDIFDVMLFWSIRDRPKSLEIFY